MLSVSRVTVERGGVAVVREVDLSVERGEVVALLGPSGAGKSSLLLAVAGLVPVAEGTVAVGNRDVTRTPPHRRGVGMVFQEYALFPHMSVAANVAYGLHGDGRSRREHDEVVDDWLERVGLSPATFRDRDVATLSGGQRQRVALARALAPAPPVLLLDEPLGALDRQLREDLLRELDAVVRAPDGPAVVVVTHDRDEAFTLGDRVGVMHDGRLVQLARPASLWARPQDEWTARFLGHPNVLGPADSEALGLEPVTTLLPAHAVQVLGRAGDADGRAAGVLDAAVVAEEREGVPAAVTAVAWRDGAQRVTVDVRDTPVVLDLPPGHPEAYAGDMLDIVIDRHSATPLAEPRD